MRNSRYFTILSNRIKSLNNNMLPKSQPLGNYSQKDIDHMASYLLLVHAEIESYFEEIIKVNLTKIFNDWKSQKKIHHSLLSFVCYYPRQEKKTPSFVIHKLKADFENELNRNNGIKSNNLSKLLSPLGFTIDNILQTSLENLGTIRGEVAHSTYKKIKSIKDPNVHLSEINQILSGIRNFDLDFQMYFKN